MKPTFATLRAIALSASLALVAPPLAAHDVSTPSPNEGLGALVFPTSAKSAAAQAEFERASLLLHLFEYDDAAKAFRKAQSLEPDFVMAVWGEAMTYNHPLWNQLDEKAGQAVLAKLGKTPAERAAKTKSAREKAYLQAVEILYSATGTKVERDARYEQAMQRLAASHPDDNQAQLFHALALEGRSEGVRNVPDYLRAAEISRRVFEKNPQNPGAAHYWIHGMDDPEHASGAIEAARALSKIAPDAGHAQHMTSHIFIAMGLWDDLVQANEDASRVVDAHNRAAARPEVKCGHYNEWLEYGYFQQGRHRDANALLLACKRTGEAAIAATKGTESGAMLAARFLGSFSAMRATAVIESADLEGSEARSAEMDGGQGGDNTYARAVNLFASGFAAAQAGDAAMAKDSQDALRALVAAAQPDPENLQLPDYLIILRDDLDGIIAAKAGNSTEAIELVRGAAKRLDGMAFDFGPPVPVKPPHELLGELLLAAGYAEQAAAEFTLSLKAAPNRAQSLLGLARAEATRGKPAESKAAYAQLLKNWHAADAGLPALQEARRSLGQE